MKVNITRQGQLPRLLAIAVLCCFTVASYAEREGSQQEQEPRKIRRTTVSPLDLTKTPTMEDLIRAGQLGGLLDPTGELPTVEASTDVNTLRRGLSDSNPQQEKAQRAKRLQREQRNKAMLMGFGDAIQDWNKHEYKAAYQKFKNYRRDFPDSPWAGEAALHMACEARYNGRYSEAEAIFSELKQLHGQSQHKGARHLSDKAQSRLGVLNAFKNNFEGALDEFTELRESTDDWRLRTYADNWIQRINSLKASNENLLDCGTRALSVILAEQGKPQAATAVLAVEPETQQGHSLSELKTIAEEHQLTLSAYKLPVAQLAEIPLPAIVQIPARSSSDLGHYWVLEKVVGDEVVLYDTQIDRRFHQSLAQFAQEWQGHTLVFGGDSQLKPFELSDADESNIFGGCCGVQAPENDLGEPESGPDTEDCPNGAPVWSVNRVNMNLYMQDIPLWYQPAYGPSVEIKLSYNSQSAIANNEPFGNKWSFNYASYIVVDPGNRATVFKADGARTTYEASWEVLWRGSQEQLETASPDTEGVYAITREVAGAYEIGYWRYSGTDLETTLTLVGEQHYQLADLTGRIYEYAIPEGTDSLQPFLVSQADAHGYQLRFSYDTDNRLASITDATGLVTQLTYNAEGVVSEVLDPFGRIAKFDYDEQLNLTKLTDMGGYWTKLRYDADVYLTDYINELGRWQFTIEPSTRASNNTVIYPAPGGAMWENYRITVEDPLHQKHEYYYDGYHGQSWYISPKHYVDYVDGNTNNYTKALKTLYKFIRLSSGKGKISEVVYPDGNSKKYSYLANSNHATKVIDSRSGEVTRTYNSKGKPLTITDRFGRLTTLTYYANGVDLETVTTELGTSTLQYNDAHQVTEVEDHRGRVLTIDYDDFGHLERANYDDAFITRYEYDTDQRLEKTRFNGELVSQYNYDAVGRVSEFIDATELALSYDYNDLNSVIKITYPDQKTVTRSFSRCPRLLDKVTSRGGQDTTFEYDAIKQLVKVREADKSVTRYGYDADGNLDTFTDKNQQQTHFGHNAVRQPSGQEYADGTKYQLSYNAKGLLETRTDARGTVTTYGYNEYNQLKTITYSDATPPVTLHYNAQYLLERVEDARGTTTWGYDEWRRVETIDGPWPEDTIHYGYDDHDRLDSLTPDRGEVVTFGYNSLNQLSTITSQEGEYRYHYNGANPLLDHLERPSGVISRYQYDAVNRIEGIQHGTEAVAASLNSFTIAYDERDNIRQIDSDLATMSPPLREEISHFNILNQQLSSSLQVAPYLYDADGNLTGGYTADGYRFTADYDAENQLRELSYRDDAGVEHKKVYVYSYDHLLAKVSTYQDGQLQDELRIVRNGFLALQDRDGSNTVQREYLWGPSMGGGIGGLLSMRQAGQSYQYLYDHNGNVSQVVDSAKQLVATYQYDPYGVLIGFSGSLQQPFTFSTKRYDAELGMHYFGYRFYLPEQGRWLNRDPIGLAGGINLYEYVGGNPLIYTDPYGLFEATMTGFLGLGGAAALADGPFLPIGDIIGAAIIVGGGIYLACSRDGNDDYTGHGENPEGQTGNGGSWDKHSGKRAGKRYGSGRNESRGKKNKKHSKPKNPNKR
ncbi:RHS repeat-associated protein [Sinobacterium caligoides]|uniref:RHS repeat-associated protein n=1 Tax=Sinobacterium caligoides TaxID=933926 RepID=A0A3N2DFV0_9GAMM|nr:RHS repeat-associated core domain-containing protein [Sinobacterium caligoides]ROR98672.1 RHS repeat-associated protein [Sinobacterium caligoides]